MRSRGCLWGTRDSLPHHPRVCQCVQPGCRAPCRHRHKPGSTHGTGDPDRQQKIFEPSIVVMMCIPGTCVESIRIPDHRHKLRTSRNQPSRCQTRLTEKCHAGGPRSAADSIHDGSNSEMGIDIRVHRNTFERTHGLDSWPTSGESALPARPILCESGDQSLCSEAANSTTWFSNPRLCGRVTRLQVSFGDDLKSACGYCGSSGSRVLRSQACYTVVMRCFGSGLQLAVR